MATPRSHLARAPIVEALIDFRIVPVQTPLEQLADLGSEIGAQYSQKLPITSISARVDLNQGQLQGSAAMQSRAGWLYKADHEVAQFRLDGFTFSRLEPYTTWGEVFGEALRLWNIYTETTHPKQVSRIAVRYLNRMKVQSPGNLEDFLVAAPVLPVPISQTIRDFLSRIHVYDAKRNASAVIIQALEPQVTPSTASLLLDIEAYRDGLALSSEDDSISNLFESLRNLKNEIFFASITEQTAELYE